ERLSVLREHFELLLEGFAKGIDPERGARLDAALREIMETYQPLKVKGTPRDIAYAAAFLGGPRSAYITGTVLPVDAGITTGDAHNYVDMMLDAVRKVMG
ncbi:MAG TPA: SDR family oxidoreductase, partial [Novosphingobium sp.]|nr:SDR family oxidoreductase [Novosphingobium sp.]